MDRRTGADHVHVPPLDREMAEPIQQALRLNGVRLHLGDAVESFVDAEGAVTASLKSGAALTADLLILAIGVRPESKLAADAGLGLGERGGILVDESMRTTDPDVYAVGDAVNVTDFVTRTQTLIPLAGPANRRGRIAADNMLGRNAKFRGTQGTSIVGLFGLTAGMTGAREKTLRRAHIDYEKVYVHPAHHVAYYPGATPMTIKMLFAKTDGRVLGGDRCARHLLSRQPRPARSASGRNLRPSADREVSDDGRIFVQTFDRPALHVPAQ